MSAALIVLAFVTLLAASPKIEGQFKHAWLIFAVFYAGVVALAWAAAWVHVQ